MSASTPGPALSMLNVPAVPVKTGGPPATWPHRALYDRVIAAIYALPHHFETRLNIEGVPATDLFTLNGPLGASIEEGMVDCLNSLREIWDPNATYATYSFVRQSQTFPDVRLQTDVPGVQNIILGIELKGWFALAKEGEPSFRYKITPLACAEADLLVVVPWVFKNVISGAPVLLKPIVVEARYAAQMRNHYWQYMRGLNDPALGEIMLAAHQSPYPSKASKCSDVPLSDVGKNFGRTARAGIFNEDVDAVLQMAAAGIPLAAWQKFIRLFTEKATRESIDDVLQGLLAQVNEKFSISPDQQTAVSNAMRAIAAAFDVVEQGSDLAARIRTRKRSRQE